MKEPDEHAPTPWDELVVVGLYPTLEQAHEHALVILAMGEACWVAEATPGEQSSLHAEVQAAPRIAQELLDYDHEQSQATPTPRIDDSPFPYPPGWGVYAIWLAALVLSFIWQLDHPSWARWASSSSVALVAHHQWWRPFTGLFLHADVAHLIGNLLSGLLFGTLVSRSIGPLRAWLLILTCGTLGNAMTSWITYPEPFTSIGASTAVFGALGILSGLGLTSMLRVRLLLPWARVIAPLFAGLILLGWLGGGREGGNTDVLGHLFGFTAGLAAGLLIGLLAPATVGTRE